MRKYHEKWVTRGPIFLLAMLTVIAAIAIAGGGIAFASAVGTEVNESARVRLTSTGAVRSSLKGFASLQLHISEQSGSSFRARAQLEGDGLDDNRLYALWLAEPGGNNLLIDTSRADEECEVDQDTGEEEGCEIVVDFSGRQMQSPLDITTLEGLTINIREHLIGTQATTPALATGTVTRSSMIGFSTANRLTL